MSPDEVMTEVRVMLARIEERQIAQATAAYSQAAVVLERHEALEKRVSDLETFRTWVYRGCAGLLASLASAVITFRSKLGIA